MCVWYVVCVCGVCKWVWLNETPTQGGRPGHSISLLAVQGRGPWRLAIWAAVAGREQLLCSGARDPTVLSTTNGLLSSLALGVTQRDNVRMPWLEKDQGPPHMQALSSVTAEGSSCPGALRDNMLPGPGRRRSSVRIFHLS